MLFFRALSLCCWLLAWPLACAAQAQPAALPTSQVVVTGQVEQEVVVTLADLARFPTHQLGDLAITNHQGQPRGTAKNLVGVLLRDVLQPAKIKAASPRQLSEFYLVCVASDGYRAVFSWNELFNSPTGDHTYLVVGKEGKPLEQIEERLLLVTTTDFRTGRRHVKNLAKIVVKLAE
jgi:hypothetical protein